MPSTDVQIPQLPFGSAECIIVRWLKRAGDTVAAGEPLLVVVNDRVEVALPALSLGSLEQILAAEGAVVMVGTPVATMAAHTPADVDDLPNAGASTIRISPVARRIVHSEKIDITGLRGTGVSGRIMKSDVVPALAAPSSAARHVTGSSPATPLLDLPSPIPDLPSPIPYILTVTEVDLERVATLIAQHGPSFARRGMELSYQVCVASAAVAALPAHPLLNSYWADSMIVTRRRIHISAVLCAGAPPGFVYDAQDLNLRGLARALGGATAERSSEDHTFVIADLGNQIWGDPSALALGGSAFRRDTTAALGLGAVCARPLVIDDAGGMDRLAVRRVALLTLAYDARVLSQLYADAFLRDVKSRLERFQI